MEKQEQLVPNPRRNVLRMAVANILTETGFGKADKQCVESLTEVRVLTIPVMRISLVAFHSFYASLSILFLFYV